MCQGTKQMRKKLQKPKSGIKAARKDTSGVFDSVLVHFGPEKARFHPTHLKMSRSFITVPTAWKLKPLTEVSLEVHVPKTKKGSMIKCHGIIINCRPIKNKKGHYQVDLLLSDIPKKYENAFDRLVPHARLT
jgi:hypothetical protein